MTIFKTSRETERDTLLTKCREIAEAAKKAGRDLTPAERIQVDADLARVKGLNEGIKGERETATIMGALDGMARDEAARRGELNPGDDSRRLSFSGKGVAGRLANAMLGGEALGTKALAPSGAVVTGAEFSPDPVALGKPAQSLLSVLPVKQHDEPTFSYLRQNVRTNNAAVVADGAVKPTSVFSLERVDATLAVIAHLSEGVPRYWLLDNTALQQFLASELQYGLSVAVEGKVLADVNATAGLQIQPYATSPLATLRKSLTLLEAAGYVPSSLVVHPTDWEGVELALSSTTAVEHLSLPYDAAARRLFGVPVVVSNVQVAGQANALSAGSVVLDTDTVGVGVQWSESSNSDDFSKNLIRARCEGRYATSVIQPFGVVKIDLTP